MSKFTLLFVLILGFVLIGCGGDNTYSPDFTGGAPAPAANFKIVVFNANLVQQAVRSSREGLIPNSAQNPDTRGQDAVMTVVVTPINGYMGPVHLSLGSTTPGWSVDALNPTDVNLDGESDAMATFEYNFVPYANNTGTTVVTAVGNGGLTHTYTVYFQQPQVNNQVH